MCQDEIVGIVVFTVLARLSLPFTIILERDVGLRRGVRFLEGVGFGLGVAAEQ